MEERMKQMVGGGGLMSGTAFYGEMQGSHSSEGSQSVPGQLRGENIFC
jgi:hypothetical protein